ncbi:pyridoxamine 5'-phosphate oxidase family protein [Halorubrum sp. Boch-26]|uniref:pyridoxamine 5'-phosphate oxidase family protein n=1 Tax=Halorubrum sp. Boch-26 TaxID=2994426 RepID=UPI002468F22D|nr:pyridoxamine 5'-phosphate oxidase family protein [Halorubrum sp. Boch-26]
MSDTHPIAMDDDERDAFLGTGGTGVVSFESSGDEPPHSVPISYGYDGSETTVYFRLAVGPDSDKGDVAGRQVTFVAYGQRDDEWRGVIAKGRLEETTEASVATESLEGLQQVHIPLVDIFGDPVKDVSFEFHRLVSYQMTSRAESSTEV